MNTKWRYIIFDFDGVLVDSNEIRYTGFEVLFKDYPKQQVMELVKYARENGGESRYKKIRLFFEKIRGELIDNKEVMRLAQCYSDIVAKQVEKAETILGSVEFLEKYSRIYKFSIVSGSDQEELRQICKSRSISKYFCKILGSPVEKAENIKQLIARDGLKASECLYIGDSINDYDAALANEIDFLGRDSGAMDWEKKVPWITDLSELEGFLFNNNKEVKK
jgi:HAD superfamily hydrolase (TIGR01549 family)